MPAGPRVLADKLISIIYIGLERKHKPRRPGSRGAPAGEMGGEMERLGERERDGERSETARERVEKDGKRQGG